MSLPNQIGQRGCQTPTGCCRLYRSVQIEPDRKRDILINQQKAELIVSTSLMIFTHINIEYAIKKLSDIFKHYYEIK